MDSQRIPLPWKPSSIAIAEEDCRGCGGRRKKERQRGGRNEISPRVSVAKYQEVERAEETVPLFFPFSRLWPGFTRFDVKEGISITVSGFFRLLDARWPGIASNIGGNLGRNDRINS